MPIVTIEFTKYNNLKNNILTIVKILCSVLYPPGLKADSTSIQTQFNTQLRENQVFTNQIR